MAPGQSYDNLGFRVALAPAPPTRWEAHEGIIYDVRHTSDGEHVISASGDGTLRLWQSETDIEPPRLREHAQGVLRHDHPHMGREQRL